MQNTRWCNLQGVYFYRQKSVFSKATQSYLSKKDKNTTKTGWLNPAFVVTDCFCLCQQNTMLEREL